MELIDETFVVAARKVSAGAEPATGRLYELKIVMPEMHKSGALFFTCVHTSSYHSEATTLMP